MSQKTRRFQWFVEPLDKDTNAVIAREVSEENFIREINDKEGVKPDVWLVPAKLMSSLRRSRNSMQLKFHIYRREGNHGQVQKLKFLGADPLRKRVGKGGKTGKTAEKVA